MSLHDRILELLQRYEKLRSQGQAITPEDLCRDCPELVEDVRGRIQGLQAIFPLLSTRDACVDAIAARDTLPEMEMHGAGRTSPGQRYKILRPHAVGGLGEVVVALDQELHREVALKRIKSGARDDRASHQLFVREAEVTARLEHPGVVPIHDLQYDADGQPYYIMKFIQGESLDAAIKRFHESDKEPKRDASERSLALRKLLNHFIDVCYTIAYAHSRGVMHRDLKPHNIMLGKYGETLVVDWGLAKSFERSELMRATGEESVRPSGVKEGDQETRVGDVKGSPAYMSPEQATGRIDQVGPASDIFALGATLYAILTGGGPFQGPDALYKASSCEFVAPRRVKRGVPAALEAVCVQAMSLNPRDRYETATALADDVARWLADEPVLAFPESRIARWTRRHDTLAKGMALCVALLALWCVGWRTNFIWAIKAPLLGTFYPPTLALLIYCLAWMCWWVGKEMGWWRRERLSLRATAILVATIGTGVCALTFLFVKL